MAWYDTGTVSVTNGSTAVVGSGTDFISAKVQVGEAFYGPDGKIYEIAAIVSSTSLTLADNYLGTTQSGQTYKIVPTQSLVADLATNVSTLITDFANVRDLAGEGKFDDGTAAAPGITFNLDQDNGLYRIGANNWAMAVGGSKIVDLTSTGFSVTGNVGIGTASPNSPLDVRGGNVYVDGGGISGASQVILATSASSGSNFGQISNTGTRWSLGYGAAIGTVGTEVLTWNSSGNVGIGVSPAKTLDVRTSSGSDAVIRVGSSSSIGINVNVGAIEFYSADADDAGVKASIANYVTGNEGPGGAVDGNLIFSTTDSDGGGNDSPTERMRIDSTGAVSIGYTGDLSNVTSGINFASGIYGMINSNNTLGSGTFGSNCVLSDAATDSWKYIGTNSASRVYHRDGVIRFDRAASGTGGTALTWSESMRIDSSGNVGIGIAPIPDNASYAGATLHVHNPSTSASTGSSLRLTNGVNGSTAGTKGFYLSQFSDTNTYFNNREGGQIFYTAGTEAMRIDSSGHAIIPAGVTLGTAVGTYNAANTLDDYEEGTWTPTLPNGGTLTVSGAYYTKIGRQVTVTAYLYNINATADSAIFQIGSLPFTTSSATSSYFAGSIGYSEAGNMASLGMINQPASTYLYFHYIDGTSTNSVTNTQMRTSHFGTASAGQIIFTFTYITD